MLCPTFASRINLDPLVVKLRCSKNTPQTFERVQHFTGASAAKGTNNDGRTMYQRKATVVQVVAVACDENSAKPQCVCCVILVRMSAASGLLDSENIRPTPPQNRCRVGREILIGIK